MADIDSGFLQKMLVTPLNRYAILLGRLIGDAFRVVIQSVIILGLSLLPFVGVRIVTGLPGITAHFVYSCFLWAGLVGYFFSDRHENP